MEDYLILPDFNVPNNTPNPQIFFNLTVKPELINIYSNIQSGVTHNDKLRELILTFLALLTLSSLFQQVH